MRAVAVFPDRKQISLVDHPEPSLASPTSVKIRILEVGICGTDREIAAFDYGFAPAGSEYLVLGHESLGEVVETGDAVTGIKPGDLAVLSVRRPCPELCPACAAGRQDFCYTGHFKERGINKLHGYLTSYVVEEQSYVYVVPKGLREIGVLTEPLTITEKAMDQMNTVSERMPWVSERPEDHMNRHALVLGAGPVGLLAAMKMVLEGYRTFVYSLGKADQQKAAIMQSIGATFLPAEDIHPAQVIDHCGGHVDLVIEALGAATISFQIIQSLGQNAIFIFTGVPGRKAPIPFDLSDLMRDMVLKNQLVFGTVNAGPIHFQNAITDLERLDARFPEAIRRLITQRFPIEQFQQPIAHPIGIKNVIQIAQ
jgi:glucose 1-dehydrogenase